MNDLISRQAAIDALCSVCGVDCDKSEFVYDGKQEDQVILCPEHYALTQLPSAQPEIIRCKDCKYYVIRTLFGRSLGWCERLCDEFDRSLARATELDDYCSRAEPKGEQE